MAVTLPSEISEFLEKCLSENIQNYEITQLVGNEKGQGFLGDILFVSLKNKTNNKEHHLVVKQVLPSESEDTIEFMSLTYINEIHFYTKILPAFQKFQESFPEAEPFNNTAKCFGISSVKGKERIVLQNLKVENYEMHPKIEYVTHDMYEALFRLYGKYHALNFAFKKIQPEKFSELKTTLNNNWISFVEKPLLSEGLKWCAKEIERVLKTHNEEAILTRFQKYLDEADKIYKDVVDYKGPYGIFVHGDCWSNNVMFKFNESKKPEHVILLDFQMINLGTPVFDLSYSFYSGANKETLRNLEKYLKIYHESLSEHLQQYGLKVEEIYPFGVLKQEWKKYCLFGFMMGYLIFSTRNIDNDDEVPDISKLMDNPDEINTIPEKPPNNAYDEAVYNLVNHMYDNNFI